MSRENCTYQAKEKKEDLAAIHRLNMEKIKSFLFTTFLRSLPGNMYRYIDIYNISL